MSMAPGRPAAAAAADLSASVASRNSPADTSPVLASRAAVTRSRAFEGPERVQALISFWVKRGLVVGFRSVRNSSRSAGARPWSWTTRSKKASAGGVNSAPASWDWTATPHRRGSCQSSSRRRPNNANPISVPTSSKRRTTLGHRSERSDGRGGGERLGVVKQPRPFRRASDPGAHPWSSAAWRIRAIASSIPVASASDRNATGLRRRRSSYSHRVER